MWSVLISIMTCKISGVCPDGTGEKLGISQHGMKGWPFRKLHITFMSNTGHIYTCPTSILTSRSYQQRLTELVFGKQRSPFITRPLHLQRKRRDRVYSACSWSCQPTHFAVRKRWTYMDNCGHGVTQTNQSVLIRFRHIAANVLRMHRTQQVHVLLGLPSSASCKSSCSRYTS